MLAALATVTYHGEYWHGVAPLVAATLSVIVGSIAWGSRSPVDMTDAHCRMKELRIIAKTRADLECQLDAGACARLLAPDAMLRRKAG